MADLIEFLERFTKNENYLFKKDVGLFRREKNIEVFEVSKSYNMSNPRKLDSGAERWSIFKDAILSSKRKHFHPKKLFCITECFIRSKQIRVTRNSWLKWFRKKYTYANYRRDAKSFLR